MAKAARRKRTTTTVEAGLAVNASLADMSRALGEGKVTASALVGAYLARIDAYDRAHNSKGPRLNSVREVNPDALSIAARLDGVKPSARQPLISASTAVALGSLSGPCVG